MKGNYFLGGKRFRPDEIPIPETGEHDVLIRVAACDVYGTDVHIYHGSKGSAEVHPPAILGHELAKVVGKTGSAVTTVKPGDHVTMDPNNYCDRCHYCEIGKKQVCESLYAVDVNRDGGFVQYCAVPETQYYQLGKEIPSKYSATTEPLACCIYGVGRIGLMPDNAVCVIGDSTVRLIMVQPARLSGTFRVVLSEPVSIRHEAGMKMGTDVIINPIHEEIGQRLTKVLGMPGADVVIECVGVPIATEQTFKTADKGAVTLLFSVPNPGSAYAMHLEEIFQRELTIVGSIVNPDTHNRAITLTDSNVIQLEPLITHLFPLDQLEQVILAQQSSESVRVIVKP